MSDKNFNLTLAQECAKAFSSVSGLGCTISDAGGTVLEEFGYGCQSCELCDALHSEKSHCVQSQNYGMVEAERFGGKYIYYCPKGLTCFVSPILGEIKSAAKITVGPFLMVEKQDYIDCDLTELFDVPSDQLQQAKKILEKIPYIPTEKVNHLSNLLFMAVGFMNNVSRENQLLSAQSSDLIQGQITTYLMQLKNEDTPPAYPLATEKEFLQSISKGDKGKAQKLLNELEGHILFSTGRNFKLVCAQIYELLVLMGRAAIDAGANAEQILQRSRGFGEKLSTFHNIEELCLWLSGITNELMDSIFKFTGARHANAMHLCTQYIDTHYAEKITLDDLARKVYLSPPYLSLIFKQEIGVTFNEYLNQVRVAKSKALLKCDGLRITDISIAVGFMDQSYFTKVFKRITGVTPNKYHDKLKTTG